MRTKLQLAVVAGVVFLFGGCSAVQRKFLFFPTHHDRSNGLAAWEVNGKRIGFSHQVSAPRAVWLMLHGNGGQASDRTYALPCFPGGDSVFILEYPGYGLRPGTPSKAAFDAAAEEGYQALRKAFPGLPVGVVGESLGSGPASLLAKQNVPPDRIILVVPFDQLAKVAARKVSFLPVKTILGPTWDNVAALSSYRGPVEIFGAGTDNVIPVEHAKNLAKNVAGAKYHEVSGGHNEWGADGTVKFLLP